MPARISETDKERLYLAWIQGEDYLQLASQLNIKRGTACSIVNRAKNRDGEFPFHVVADDMRNLMTKLEMLCQQLLRNIQLSH